MIFVLYNFVYLIESVRSLSDIIMLGSRDGMKIARKSLKITILSKISFILTERTFGFGL